MQSFGRQAAHVAIRFYQLTFSSLVGRQCRHLPTCSHFADEAIHRHGVWIGGWMGLARICRCHPWGTAGFDPVPATLPRAAHGWRPWRYGHWRSIDESEAEPKSEAEPGSEAESQSEAERKSEAAATRT